MRVTGVVFGVTAAVIAGSTLLTYQAGQRVIQLHQAEEKRRIAIMACDDLFSAVQDAETGQRGFIITGNESYLQPFNRAVQRIPAATQRLHELTDIGITPEKSADLDAAVKDKLAELRQTINLRRTGGFNAAIGMIESDRGEEAMDRIRAAFERIRTEQEAGLKADSQASASATIARTLIFLATAALSLLVLLWGFFRIRKAIKERNLAVLEQQRERDLLSTTLTSIGDCVIVTDIEGRITFLNPVASAVTGWTLEEAMGRPVEEVFRIMSEETRELVPNPVEKVIRRGVIVGLGNHTVLIRKDGTELPIDDSAAPVRTPEGKLEGVVLVFRDFSATKNTQRELREAKETAEEANRAKDTFLAMLSHELRTPLTPVLATLQAWDMTRAVPDELKKDVYMLRRNVEMEARLINDLLDLTRISRGVLSFHPETVDAHAILQLLIAQTRSDADRKRLNLEVNLEAKRHFVNTDASRLQQVLWNIIRNAVNYTDANGTVAIKTSDDGARLTIIITDTGLGMSPETLQKIFIPFEQADRARSVRHGGLGLGLAISRALVEQMGGELDAASGGLGRGSKFTLRLQAVDEKAAAAGDPHRAAPVRSGPLRILLVEDHVDTALALARLLKMRGHEVRTASMVEEAQAQLKNGTFDLLICDIGLPDGTGYDLIKSVRERSDIVAIAVTGFGMQADVDEAIASGFDAHVTKPIDLHKLEMAIIQAEQSHDNRSGSH